METESEEILEIGKVARKKINWNKGFPKLISRFGFALAIVSGLLGFIIPLLGALWFFFWHNDRVGITCGLLLIFLQITFWITAMVWNEEFE